MLDFLAAVEPDEGVEQEQGRAQGGDGGDEALLIAREVETKRGGR